MKKPSFSQRYPLVARMCRFWDNLLNWTENRAALLRKKIRKILKPDRSWRRRSYLPEMEGLEFRWMPALHVTNFTPTATGYRVQFDQPVDPTPLNIYDASGAYGAADATMYTGNQVEKIAFTGTVTGGTFTLAYNGATTAAISYSATASTLQTNVQNALDALTSVGSGNSAVNAVSSTQVQVTFQGSLAMQTMATMTAVSSLTGTTPSLDVTNLATPDLVKLAAIPNADNSAFTFIRAGAGSAGLFPGVLTAGSYRLVLHSASNAFKDLGGGLLDGDNNGSTGDDYVNTITVNSTPSVILSIPDVARGPDSSHNIRVASNVGNAVQTISFTGATGGTFILSFNGASTGAINYSTVASTLQSNVQSALDVLSSIGLANTAVSSSATAPQVTFQLGLGGATQPDMTVSNSLTGSTPTVSVATTTAGKNTFIPITLSGAVNVTDVTFDLAYDPDLLNVSGTFDATAGSLTLVSATNGVASFNFHSGTARSGTVTLGQIVSQAPDSSNDSYGASRVLDLSNIVINGGAISATADGAVQVVAYLGDVSGDGTFSSTDATLIGNVANVSASGFTAYRLIDPKVIGDLNANGFVDSGDTSLTNNLLAGNQPNQYPPLPPTTHFNVVPSTNYPSSSSAFSVTLTALDQFNHQSFFYGGLVHFTTTDPHTSVSLPSDYRFVDIDVGVHTFTNGVTLYTAGSQTVTATDTSSSGITGTSNPIYPLGVANGYVRTADPVQSARVPVGSALVLPGTGSVIVGHMLDLDRSPATPTLGGEPTLIFNSGTVNVFPIVEAVYTSDPGAAVPSQIEVRLNWNGGGFGGWTTFSTSGHSAGDTYVVALQVGSAVTTTDYYSFTIDVKVTVSGTPTTYTSSGNAAIVVQGSSDAFGQGWSLAGVDHLVTTTNGAILVDGETGSGRYFALGGGVYTSPANDFGHLVHTGNTYTYETEHLLTYTFDSNGNLAKIADPHGLARTFIYDGNGLLTQIKDPDGSTATLSYDGSHKLSKIEAPGPRTVTVTVDGSGNLTKIVNPDNGVRTFTYDGSHRLTDDHFAPLGTFSYGYSSGNGTLTTVTLDATTSYTLSAGNAQALATSPAKNLAAAAGKLTDPLGHVYTYTLDAQDRLAKLETPNGGAGLLTETWNRTLAGLPIGHTDPLGRLTNYGYDGSGDMTGVFYPDHTQQTTVYDATFHLPTSMTDQRGNVTQYLYDSAASLTAVVDPLNQMTSFLRDAAGNATVMVDALGNRTSYLFDATNMATVVIDAFLRRTSYMLDATGNATVVVDPLTHRTTTAFDGMRRVTSVTQRGLVSGSPASIISSSAYDYTGHVTDQTDADNVVTRYAYDAQGRLTVTTTAYGTGVAASVTNLYDAAGNLTQVTDPRGQAIQYHYDSLNRATVTIDQLGRTTTRMFDAVSNMTGLKDARDKLTQYSYDSLNRPIATIDQLGKRTTSLWDRAGNVTGVLDANRNLTKRLFDANNRLTQTTDPLGGVSSVLYDPLGRVTESFDPMGRTRQWAYDAVGRMTMTTDGVGNSAYTNYDDNDQVIFQSDFSGENGAANFYDGAGRLTGVIDAAGNFTTLTLDGVGRVIERRDGNNHPTNYLYDAGGRLTVITDALSHSMTLVLDAAGAATVVIDPLGRYTTYLLDAAGQTTVIIDALLGRTTMVYDQVGHLTQLTDPNNHTSQTVYDDAGRQIASVDALGARTTYLLDSVGNATGMLDPLAHLTTYLLDANNRVTVAIDPMGGRTTMLYDLAGNATEVFDARNNPTQYHFDGNSRVTETIDALGGITTTIYDMTGNVTEIIDANSHTNSFAYDQNNRQIAQSDGLNHETLTFYDGAGNVTGVLDANGHGTSYIYDDANRQIAVRDALGRLTTSTYDDAGNRISLTDALLHTSTYQFDALNRMTGMTDPLGNHTAYVADPVGNVTVVVDARHNRTSYLFDALNRQTVTIDALDHRTTLLFDLAGNLTGQQDALNRLSTSIYDLDNRLTVMVDAQDNRTTLTLDAMGNRTALTDALLHTSTYVFDALNRQTVTVDALTNHTTLVLDAVGNATVVIDANNHRTSYLYDANNRQTVTIDALLGYTTLTLDAVGNATVVTDANNHVTSYLFDELNRSTVTIDALLGYTTVTLDAVGNATVIQDANGNVTSYLYDADNRQTVTIDPLGRYTTQVLDAVGNVITVIDANGHQTRYRYDELNRRISTIDALNNRTRTFYDAVDNVTGTVSSVIVPTDFALDEVTGSPFDLGYDASETGRGQKAGDFNEDSYDDLLTANDSGESITIFLSNGDGTFTEDDTYPLGYGVISQAIADVNNDGHLDIVNLYRSTYVGVLLGAGDGTFGGVIDTSAPVYYNATDIVVADFDNDDTLDVAVSYESAGVALAMGNGDGTFGSFTLYAAENGAFAVITADFDNDHNIDVATANVYGGTFSIFMGNGDGTLDAANNVAAGYYPTEIAVGHFNGDGDLDLATANLFDATVTIVAGNGDGTFQTPVTISVADYPWPVAGIDLSGMDQGYLIVITNDPNGSGGVTPCDIQVLVPTADGTYGVAQTLSIGFSPVGPLVGDFNGDDAPDVAFINRADSPYSTLSVFLTQPGDSPTHALTTQYGYDALNRLTMTVDPLEHPTYQFYDKVGNVTGIQDANNNLTSFVFDAVNRVTSQSQTLNGTLRTTTFAYDKVGLMTSTTDALTRRRDFRFDALNRLTTETWYAAGSSSPAQLFTSMYDAVGNMTVAANAAGIYTMSYDALNRVTVTQEPFNQRLTFSYDAVGNRTEVRDSQNGGITTSLFDAVNRVTSRQFSGATGPELCVDSTYTGSGMLESLKRYSDLAATTTVAVTSYLYDVADRVTAILHNKDNGDSLASMLYQYDPSGRLLHETVNGVDRSFVYDDASQLTADGTKTYTYDDGGNRNSGDYATVSGNLMSTDGVWTYTYDAVGNLTKKSKGAAAETWTYGYDNKNELIWAEDRSTDNGTIIARADYKYDYFGGRIEKAVDADGAGGGGTTTTTFAYDGDEIWGDFVSGSLTTRYLHGDAVDELYARIAGGTAGWFLTDHLGSVRNVIGNNAAFLATLTYDGWGNATVSGAAGDYQWTGRQVDVETGLQYNRARYYDPMTGRWMTQDPLGFDAGDSNLYRYVNNAPTNATDPSGKYLVALGDAKDAILKRFSTGPTKVDLEAIPLPLPNLGSAPDANIRAKKQLYWIRLAAGGANSAGAPFISERTRPLDSLVYKVITAGGPVDDKSGAFGYATKGSDPNSPNGYVSLSSIAQSYYLTKTQLNFIAGNSQSSSKRLVVIVVMPGGGGPLNQSSGKLFDAKIPVFPRKKTTGEEDITAFMQGIGYGMDVMGDTFTRLAYTTYHIGDAILGDIIRAIPASYDAAKDVLNSENFQQAFIKSMQYQLAIYGGAADKLQTITGVFAFQQFAGGFTVTAKGELVANNLVPQGIADTGGIMGAGAFDVVMIVLPFGALGAGASTSAGRLVHLTDAKGGAGIVQSGVLRGNNYAGPFANANAEGLGVTLRTGLSPNAYQVAVPIPTAGQAAFGKVVPIGPISGWQWMTGQQYTARGVLNLQTGEFVRQGVNWNQVTIYVIDATITTGTVAGVGGGAYYLSNK